MRKVVQNSGAETSKLLLTEPGQPQGAMQNLTEVQLEYCSHARGSTAPEMINPVKRNLLNWERLQTTSKHRALHMLVLPDLYLQHL